MFAKYNCQRTLTRRHMSSVRRVHDHRFAMIRHENVHRSLNGARFAQGRTPPVHVFAEASTARGCNERGDERDKSNPMEKGKSLSVRRKGQIWVRDSSGCDGWCETAMHVTRSGVPRLGGRLHMRGINGVRVVSGMK